MRLLAILPVFAGSLALAGQTMEVGDGRIDGRKLEPYEFTWQQCSLSDERWASAPPLTERLVRIGDDLLRITQTVQRPDGSNVVATFYFDRQSLAPLRLEQRAAATDGSDLGRSEHDLHDDGYTGLMVQGNRSKDVFGKVSAKMLHGGALGLPLALLPYQEEPLRFAASMISFDATYQVTATWVGKDTLALGEQEVDAWLVDVEWLHEGIGDVYPGGPDNSGGRYWLVNNPPDGFPRVPRYQTDTYAIEFVPGVCPEAAMEEAED